MNFWRNRYSDSEFTLQKKAIFNHRLSSIIDSQVIESHYFYWTVHRNINGENDKLKRKMWTGNTMLNDICIHVPQSSIINKILVTINKGNLFGHDAIYILHCFSTSFCPDLRIIDTDPVSLNGQGMTISSFISPIRESDRPTISPVTRQQNVHHDRDRWLMESPIAR